MKGKVITVFGGAGFVGRTLVQRLAKEGALLRVVVTDPDAAIFLKAMGEPGQITLFTVDLHDPQQVDNICQDAWAAINLIGTLYERRNKTFDFMHVDIPEMIGRACHNKSVERFVHISAIGADPESDSDYACTKGMGEQKVRHIFPNVTIVRPSVIFGANDKFFNLFASLVVFSPVLPIFGKGDTKMQPVYVGDVADAIVKILKTPVSVAQIYELGGPKIYTFRELIDLILKLTGRKRRVVSLPTFMGRVMAMFLQYLPTPPLTPDQLKLLKKDNIVDPKAKSLTDLAVVPTAAEAILPTYLNRYQPSF